MENHKHRTSSRLGQGLMAAGVLSFALVACASPPVRAEHLSAGCGSGHRIALTFDDGPNPPWTQEVLDILRAHGARATFFDEGQAVESHPDLPPQEIEAGMAVGSHSYTHATTLPTMTAAEFAHDLQRAERALSAAVGVRPALYRAPYGHTSEMMLGELRRGGYVSIGWDVDSRDWSSDSSADDIVRNVLEAAHPGAIVLMHDGGLGGGDPDRTRTVAALPRIIDGLHERGYELVTIPELTGAPEHQGSARRDLCSAS
jgi:peptidoglycan/xylan/chitin deacetylase (PgdA/CDA1 family)